MAKPVHMIDDENEAPHTAGFTVCGMGIWGVETGSNPTCPWCAERNRAQIAEKRALDLRRGLIRANTTLLGWPNTHGLNALVHELTVLIDADIIFSPTRKGDGQS